MLCSFPHLLWILTDFLCGTVIRCHLSNKSVRQISALLELPRSTVSAVIVKWQRQGATTAQPRSGRPQTLTERDRRVLKCVVWKNRLSSTATLTTEFHLTLEATSAQTVFVESFRKWVSMAEQPNTSLRSPCAMPSVEYGLELCKVHRHWTLEQWKRVVWIDESRFTIWQAVRRTNLGLADTRRMLPA